jgi:hypothetical protein
MKFPDTVVFDIFVYAEKASYPIHVHETMFPGAFDRWYQYPPFTGADACCSTTDHDYRQRPFPNRVAFLLVFPRVRPSGRKTECSPVRRIPPGNPFKLCHMV